MNLDAKRVCFLYQEGPKSREKQSIWSHPGDIFEHKKREEEEEEEEARELRDESSKRKKAN